MVIRLVFGHEDIFPSIEHLVEALIRQVPVFGDRNTKKGLSLITKALTKALVGWKQGFEDTKAGKMKASVAFRFNQRFGDATTAHETGMFLYTSEPSGSEPNKAYIHFEALLRKDGQGEWKVMMEYQKSAATAEAWEALAN